MGRRSPRENTVRFLTESTPPLARSRRHSPRAMHGPRCGLWQSLRSPACPDASAYLKESGKVLTASITQTGTEVISYK